MTQMILNLILIFDLYENLLLLKFNFSKILILNLRLESSESVLENNLELFRDERTLSSKNINFFYYKFYVILLFWIIKNKV